MNNGIPKLNVIVVGLTLKIHTFYFLSWMHSMYIQVRSVNLFVCYLRVSDSEMFCIIVYVVSEWGWSRRPD